ncbi:MAG: bifunctional heptose 7-phosphate kinase/heptose 1-phosphate adenyltransferase [Verrucomicrobiales bacterium]
MDWEVLLSGMRSRVIVVVGDLMLDRFIWGHVSRISPEAPVPVVEVDQDSSYPGGAANVARNLREFCDEVRLLGLVGKDPAGEELLRLLDEGGIKHSTVLRSSEVMTTVKTRVLARQQQVVRVDREKMINWTPELRRECESKLAQAIQGADAVLFEDYAKGFIDQNLVNKAVELAPGKVLSADPNPRNSLRWRGFTVVKPNLTEAVQLTSLVKGPPAPGQSFALGELGKTLLDYWECQQVLITRGEDGMSLFIQPGQQGSLEEFHAPAKKRDVFDVSGAGDTAISLYTLALLESGDPQLAARVATAASGLVVTKLGTAKVGVEELLVELQKTA